jgi:hypothetical protein
MQSATLMGHFTRKRMLTNTLKKWTTEKFSRLIEYEPKSLVLVKGWLAWIMCTCPYVEHILKTHWNWGEHVLFLKIWSVDFDAKSERLEVTPMWVFFPLLPLILCLEEVFREIGNALGFCYEYEFSYQSIRYMGMTRIFVGLKLLRGLMESITIQRHNAIFYKEIDYEEITFFYGRFQFWGWNNEKR